MRLTCRATKAAVGAELTSVLRQVDRMMHSVGRRYYQGRRWGRMRQRDWLVLLPDWPCAAPEIAVDEGVRLGVLSVLPAGELGQWLSVDYATLVCRISNAEKDLPPGSGPGPKVSPTLGAWGARSAPAYSAMLNLAYRWFDPGVTRHPVHGGHHSAAIGAGRTAQPSGRGLGGPALARGRGRAPHRGSPGAPTSGRSPGRLVTFSRAIMVVQPCTLARSAKLTDPDPDPDPSGGGRSAGAVRPGGRRPRRQEQKWHVPLVDVPDRPEHRRVPSRRGSVQLAGVRGSDHGRRLLPP